MKVRDLDDETIYREIDNFRNSITEGLDQVGDRITKGLERIETTKEPLWAIPSEKRENFYKSLLICVVIVSLWTLIEKWCFVWEWKALCNLLKVETFYDVGKGIFSSVVIIWFIFQAGDAAMSWGKAITEGMFNRGVKKARRMSVSEW